jgi:class 3 adenylate cyclase
MGAVTLDLRGATIESAEIEINCWAIMGAVDVIVPEGFPVDFDGFVFMGGRDERLADVAPVPGAPTIRVRGYGFWGAVTVRSKPPRQPGRKRDKREKREKRREERRGRDRMIPPAPQTPPIPPMPPIPDPLAVLRTGHRHRHGWWGQQSAEEHDDDAASPARGVRHLGTVTILVTDIVSSTAHAERLGDQRWLAVLRSHNALVREQLAAHSGTEVKQSGDGFLATFASARDAVRAGIGIRRSIDGYRNSNPQAPLELRIGVHSGEVEHDGDDVFGVNVSTADRVADAAQPGEILVSGVVRDLADSTSDLRFGDAKEIPVAGRAVPLRVHPVLEV